MLICENASLTKDLMTRFFSEQTVSELLQQALCLLTHARWSERSDIKLSGLKAIASVLGVMSHSSCVSYPVLEDTLFINKLGNRVASLSHVDPVAQVRELSEGILKLLPGDRMVPWLQD